jgi:hypothetical protein
MATPTGRCEEQTQPFQAHSLSRMHPALQRLQFAREARQMRSAQVCVTVDGDVQLLLELERVFNRRFSHCAIQS